MKSILGLLLLAASAQAAVPIAGKDIATGKTINWKAGSKPSVVVFLSPSCPCSQSHEGSIAKLANQFPQFQFVGVVSNAAQHGASVTEHFKAAKLPFPVIAETELELADAFGALNTPHAFVIDAKGETVFQGGVDDSRKRSAGH